MQFIYRTHARLVAKYGRNTVLVGATIAGILTAFLFYNIFKGDEAIEPVEATQKTVAVALVQDLMGTSGNIETLGTIEAVHEARLVTEAGGRVTSVPVKLGDFISAGSVIATIENSRERAMVLQAQGSYEAALATAAASEVGSESADRAYREALTQGVNAYRGAFATADNVLRNTVDQVFSQPDSNTPGVRIDAHGRANELNEERVALESIFDAWALKINTNLEGNVGTLLSEAEGNTTRLATLLSTLTSLLSDDDALADNDELQTLRTDFATARTTLNSALQALSQARSALIAAKSAQEQAEIAASEGDVSLGDAQVKQALGSLRLAQAGLEKTIVRSPISGKVNAVTLKEGTTVTAGTPAAVISSAGGLMVVAFVNESDAPRIQRGDAVTIEGTAKGVVTEIASAIDTETKKIEIRIGITGEGSSLINGETVRIGITGETTDTNDTTAILLPVIAIKMTPTGPIVFSVDTENTLVPHEVTLGAIVGDHIVIESGIEKDLTIVTDARGLRAGEKVTVQ